MHSPSANSDSDLNDHIELLRQEVRVLRDAIDEFQSNLVPAVRNIADTLQAGDLSAFSFQTPPPAPTEQPSTNSKRQRFLPIDFHELKLRVSIVDVLGLFDWQLAKKSAGQLRGPCPVHGSTSATSQTFVVTPSKNAWKCFKCNSGGNQLDLAAHYLDFEPNNIVQVAIRLCERLGIEVPRKSELSSRG